VDLLCYALKRHKTVLFWACEVSRHLILLLGLCAEGRVV
jgi:hypothetical protein